MKTNPYMRFVSAVYEIIWLRASRTTDLNELQRLENGLKRLHKETMKFLYS